MFILLGADKKFVVRMRTHAHPANTPRTASKNCKHRATTAHTPWDKDAGRKTAHKLQKHATGQRHAHTHNTGPVWCDRLDGQTHGQVNEEMLLTTQVLKTRGMSRSYLKFTGQTQGLRTCTREDNVDSSVTTRASHEATPAKLAERCIMAHHTQQCRR